MNDIVELEIGRNGVKSTKKKTKKDIVEETMSDIERFRKLGWNVEDRPMNYQEFRDMYIFDIIRTTKDWDIKVAMEDVEDIIDCVYSREIDRKWEEYRESNEC